MRRTGITPAGLRPGAGYSRIRCYGKSMDFLFASGDQLVVDPGAKRDPGRIKPGDIIAYLDWTDAPLVSVHRVIVKLGTRTGEAKFLTKGDGNLWFDPLVNGGQIIGKVVGILRDPDAPVAIDSKLGYAAGILISFYSYFAVLAVRACEAAAAVAQRLIYLAASAATNSARRLPLPPGLPSALLELGLMADLNRHDRFYAFFSLLPAKIMEFVADAAGRPADFVRDTDIPAPVVGETVIAGNIKNRLTLGGRITIAGDVTILPGAALVLEPGARVTFAAAKSTNSAALRPVEKGLSAFKNDKLCKIMVYGEFICGGTAEAPVKIGGGGDKWDSLIFLGRSRGSLENVSFSGALNPLRVMDFSRVRLTAIGAAGYGGKEFLALSGCSRTELRGTLLRDIQYPVAVREFARLTARNCQFENSATAIYTAGLARSRASRCDFRNFSAHACHVSDKASLFASGCRASAGHTPFSGEKESAVVLYRVKAEDSAGPAVAFSGRALKLNACRISGNARGVLVSGGRAFVAASVFSHNSGLALQVNKGSLRAHGCSFLSNPEAFKAGLGARAGLSSCAVQASEICAVSCVDPRTRVTLSDLEIKDCRRGIHVSQARVSGSDISVRDSRERGVYLENRAVFHSVGGGILGSGAQAVRLESGSRLSLRAMRIAGNADGILSEDSGTALDGGEFSDNAGFAVCLNGGAHEIRACGMTGGKIGLGIYKRAKCRVDALSVSGTSSEALDVSSGARAALSDIDAAECGRGICVSGAHVSGKNVLIRGCRERGAHLEKGAAFRCAGGEIRGCGAQAVYLESGSRLSLSGMRVTGNGNGVFSENSSTELVGGQFTNNDGFAVQLNGGAHKIRACGMTGGKTGLGVYKGARCAADDLSVSGTNSEAIDVSAAGARLRKVSARACGEGMKFRNGAHVSAHGLIAENLASHGVVVSEDSVFYAKGGDIASCAGCAVFASGPCSVSLDSVTLRECRSGLAFTQGGEARLRDSEISDIAGPCVSCSGGKLTAVRMTLARAGTGFSVHLGSSAAISRSDIAMMSIGVETTGNSRTSLAETSIRACGKGAWLQNDSRTEVSRCVFADSAEGGICADGGGCRARGTAFKKNNIGAFADRGGVLEISGARFIGNRTGVKADNNSEVTISSTLFSGCEWDAVWCGGNTGVYLAGNTFESNRYGIKEDGPCAVETVRNKFVKSGAADHLTWPHP